MLQLKKKTMLKNVTRIARKKYNEIIKKGFERK
jgi:hypothetical protein